MKTCPILQSSSSALGWVFALLFASGAFAFAAPPDLTTGGVPGDTVTTNLGPTGLRGWVYHVGIDSSESRQIQVQVVDTGSPAAGILAANDVILGANGTGAAPVNFTADARKSFANAINDAEARTPAELKVLRWRAGITTTETLTLRTMGAYSATAPYNCPKSAKILEEGLEAIMTTGETAGAFSLGTLSLLAGNNSANPKNAARQARAQTEARALIPNAAQLADLTPAATGFLWGDPWADGHKLIVLTEYYLQTNDALVLPAIEAYSKAVIGGQNLFGTYSHVYSARWRDGTPNGPMRNYYGTVNNASMPGWLGLLLTKECGVVNPDLAPAIERASRFYSYYSGKSAIPYGEHQAGAGGHENNGKSGLAAVCYELESHRAVPQKFFAKMAVAATTERDIGHTGPYFNHFWSPLGAAVGGEAAAASHFSRVRWMLDLNRRWNGLFVSNRYGEDSEYDSYSDFRMSTPALLTYALPLRQLHITGRGHDPLRQLSSQDVVEAEAVDGYRSAPRTTSQLVTDLGNWSPFAQLSAAQELGNRPAETTALLPALHAMATDPQGTSRVGATFALGYIGHASSAGILATLLSDPVNHVRYAAAEALKAMPQNARAPHLNTVLAAAAANAAPLLPFNEEDPAHLSHASFGPLLFASDGMVPANLVGVDRNFLYPAIRAVAQNPVGYCRSSLSRIYDNLSQTDYQALADTLVYSAYELTPADKMFAYGDRFAAQRAMKRFNTAEGVPLCLLAVEDAMYGDMSQQSLATLQLYAGSSKTVQPDPDVEGAMNFLIQSGTNVAEAQAVLAAIAGDPNPTPLQPLKSIQSVTADAPSLTLPAKTTALHVTASDLAKGDSIYTWRKVHGKSDVTFTPNGTAAAKDSTVLINGLPGQYRFQVTMSDSRGLTEVSSTVNVTLYDTGGTLPPNSPPVANPQSLTVVRMFSQPITLSGSDQEGYPLIYRIVNQPSDGVLSGTLPNLTYTPKPDGVATSDSFTFEVMDSEGQIDVETISITLNNTVRADGINWGTPTTTTSPTSIVTAGTLVTSRTGHDNSGTITVNGVSFFQGKTLASSGANTSLCPDTGTGAENIALESLLDRISWGSSSFQVTGLTPGTRYLIQIFLCDYRGTRQMVLSDEIGGTDTATLTTNPAGAFGQNVIGTFTAGSSSQTIYVAGLGGETTHLNAWQLRQVPDGVSPTPSPLTWATSPTASGMHAVNMTASTATDANGVEYFFDETTANSGGTDSGWQDSPSYTDTLLTPGTTYTYRVTARDKSSGRNTTIPSTAATVTTGSSNLPRKVWNVNIGSEITTSDNFTGAAAENTTNSTWNSVVNPLPKTDFALVNSSGAATTARLDISAVNGGNNFGMATAGLTSGDEIFRSYIGGAGATVTMLLHGLPAGHTYDLIVYSDWFWKNGDSGYPVTQTIGTGLSGTIYTNRSFGPYVNGQVPPLQQDPNPADVMGAGNEGNWYRITNLTPNASGQLGFRTGDSVNGPINGFQLIGIPIDPGDLTPPAPNPMTWATAPTPSGSTSITMTATTASDVDGVQYIFEETSGNPGASSSTWQDSPVFTDTGLTIGMTYTYRVKARDKSPNANETGWSPALSATAAAPSDTSPPTPSPMTWASAPAATGQTAITMTATTASDANGVEYYFDETSGNPGATDSDWQDSPTYTDSGLDPSTTYTYQVRARDKSPQANETAYSASAQATTQTPPPVFTLYWEGNDTTANADGGAGIWADGSNNWDSAANAGLNTAWNNNKNDTAVFGGTAGTVTIAAGGVTAGGVEFNTASYIIGDYGSGVATGGPALHFGSAGTIQNSVNAIISAPIGGTFGFSKTGPGVLELRNTAHTFTGNINVGGGTLRFGQESSTAGINDIKLGNGNFTGNIAIASGATLEFWSSQTQEFSGIISGAGSVNFRLTPTVTLSGANTYTGATTLAGGTLAVNTLANAGTASSIGNFATAGATGLTLSGGTFSYTGASTTTDRGFTVNGNGVKSTISVGAGMALNLGASVKNEIQTVNTNGLGLSASGAGSSITISSLTITPGTNADFNISATNSPTVTIQNLNVSGYNVISQRATGGAILNVGNIIGTGASGWLSGMNVTGVISGYTGAITLGGGNTTFTGLSTFDTTVTAQQSGICSFNTIKNVGGGASALGAPTTVANGTIGFGNGGNTPTFRYTGTGDTTDRVLNLRGTATLNLEQAGTGPLKFTGNTTAATGAKTLNLTGSTTGTGEFAGAIVDNSATNKTSVTKNGTGTWTLSGANTYTGATTVSAGTLLIDGNQSAATGATTVASEATLGGKGTLGGDLNVLAGGKLAFDLSTVADNHDRLELSTGKTLTFSGASTLTITSTAGASPGLYTLVRGGNNISSVVPATVILPSGWAADPPVIIGNELRLNITSTGGSAYDTWKAANAPGSNPDDDSDGDGVDNALEFLLGGSSATKDLGKLPAVSNDGSDMLFTFYRSQSSIDLKTTTTIELGTNLATWPSSYAVPDGAIANNPGVTVVKNNPAAGSDKITLRVPNAPDNSKFARIKVAITP